MEGGAVSVRRVEGEMHCVYIQYIGIEPRVIKEGVCVCVCVCARAHLTPPNAPDRTDCLKHVRSVHVEAGVGVNARKDAAAVKRDA